MQREDLHPSGSTTFAPLQNVAFRSIWTSTQIANLGWLVQTVAISWLMATISASDLMVALVQASTTLPAFILSIVAGAIADSFSRRSVMVAGLSLIALASIVLALSAGFGFVSPWLILGLGFLAGCGFALNDPAWHASVGDILDKRDIPSAVTLMSVGYNMTRSIGPALGGAILAFLGPLAAFVFAALSNLAPLGSVLRNKWHVRSSPLPPERIATAIHDGMRFTALSSDIRAAIIRATLFGLAAISILALLPLVARDRLAGGPIIYGILFAGFGTGACIAGLSNQYLRKLVPQEWLMAIAAIACALCCLALALTSSPVLATLALAVGGSGWVITWTGFDVWVQLASPRWVVGRTLSIYYACLSGGMAAGSWIWGTVAQSYSLAASLELAAGALFLVAALGFVLPVLLGEDGDQYGSDFRAPELALDLKPRSVPSRQRPSIPSPRRISRSFSATCVRADTRSAEPAHVTGPCSEIFASRRCGRKHSARQPGWISFASITGFRQRTMKSANSSQACIKETHFPRPILRSSERQTRFGPAVGRSRVFRVHEVSL